MAYPCEIEGCADPQSHRGSRHDLLAEFDGVEGDDGNLLPYWKPCERADIPDGARVREIHEGRWRLTPNGKYLDREWRDIRYQVWTEGTPC